MNMSEFDGQMNREDAGSSPISIGGHKIPDDFSDEDMTFAQELGSLFDVEQEDLPPYFVQTLLDSENPRFQPVEQGFEHKARALVFRRLNLKRRLFGKNHFSVGSVVAALPGPSSTGSIWHGDDAVYADDRHYYRPVICRWHGNSAGRRQNRCHDSTRIPAYSCH